MLILQQGSASNPELYLLICIVPHQLYITTKKTNQKEHHPLHTTAIHNINLQTKIIATSSLSISFSQIIHFRNTLVLIELNQQQIIKWYVYGQESTEPTNRLVTIKNILNQRLEVEDLYLTRICRDRSIINEAIFKILLMSFALFCLFQYYICRLLLAIMRPINWLTSFIGYVPLIHIQNQLIFKANLIGNSLTQSLKGVFQSPDYRTVFKNYLRVMNIICFVLLDSALGLISLLATKTFIRNLLRILKYVTVTVHLAFLNGRIWTSDLKDKMCFNNLCQYADTTISLIIEYSNKYLKIDFFSLSQGYIFVAYIGFSFQILLTLQLAYLLSINIFLLYKLIAKIYQFSIAAIRTLYSIIRSTLKNNLTVKIPNIYLRPWIKITCTMALIIIISVLPATVLYYFWFIGSVALFRLITNLMMALLSIFNRLPLISFLETLKKPHLYPHVLIWNQNQLHSKPVSRFDLCFELAKKTFLKVRPIVSARMLKKILQGDDLIQQQSLSSLKTGGLDISTLFRQLCKL